MNIRDSKENMVIDMAERLPKNTYRQASVAPLETYPSHQKNPHYDCCCNHHREARELLVAPGTTSSKNGTEFIDPSLLQSLAAMIGFGAAKADSSVLSQIAKVAAHGAEISKGTDIQELQAAYKDFVDIQSLAQKGDTASESRELVSRGVGSSIIGGCCCVDLSIEYLPSNILSEANCAVAVATIDTSGTICSWAQICGAQSGYEIRENIISTNPGARLVVVTLNLVARVRWCEHFAC